MLWHILRLLIHSLVKTVQGSFKIELSKSSSKLFIILLSSSAFLIVSDVQTANESELKFSAGLLLKTNKVN